MDALFSELAAQLGIPAATAQSVPGYDPVNPQMDYMPSSELPTVTVPFSAVPTSPSASVGGSHSAGYPNCREKIGIFAIPARISYLDSATGVPYMKMPLIHRASGLLVYAIAPAVNCDRATILRDCPELCDYTPVIPQDCPWATTTSYGRPLTIRGTLLHPVDSIWARSYCRTRGMKRSRRRVAAFLAVNSSLFKFQL